VNSGGNTSGGLTVPSAATIALSPGSIAGWASAPLWEIYDYPSGWATPSGWTLAASGVIFSTANTPPSITLPANTVQWGKWAIRLTVNGNADPTNKNLVDETTILSMVSPNTGMPAVAFNEGSQFGTLRQWVGALKAALNALDLGLFGPSSKSLVTPLVDALATTNATPTVFPNAQFTCPDLTTIDVVVTVLAKQLSSNNLFRNDYRATYYRNGGALTLQGSVSSGTAVGTLLATATLVLSSNTVQIQATGIAATNIDWSATMQIQQVQ
jgi:hypothetical protein